MEEANKDPAEASVPCVGSEKQEALSGVSTQEVEEGTSVEVNEEFKEDLEGNEKWITPPRLINLKRDLQTLVTNIQTAADAKESMRRTELEEALRLRLEKLENDVKSSQEKFEAITKGWSLAKEKVIPQELQEALNLQQELCAALTDDKKQLISDLQQELKVRDDRYIKDLRRQEEELDLMMERMEDQIQTLTKAYREELVQMERVYQQESEVLLTRDKTEWEGHMKELLENELERLAQRKKTVEENEAMIHNLMLENMDSYSLAQTERNAKFQTLERETQQINATRMIMRLKEIRQKDEAAVHKFNLAHMKSRISSLEKEWKKLLDKYSSREKQFTKKCRSLSEDYKRNIQQSERIRKKMKHFAAADVIKFEEMFVMVDAEVKQLVEKALLVDSLICKQHLSPGWKGPAVSFMEPSGPIQPKKQASQGDQRGLEAPVGSELEADTERTDMETYQEAAVEQSDSGAELSVETVNKVKELLCDEAGFLIEENLLNLLTPMEKEKQTVVKLCSLLNSFGIGEEDLPKLALFLLKYQQTEDVCVASGESSEEVENSTTHTTSDLIRPNQVVPALKSFLEQLTRSRESSALRHLSFLDLEGRDAPEEYWENLGNIISEDKLTLWDAVESTLKQHLAVLTETSELVPETQSLERQNNELRMLLQQSLTSSMSSCVGLFST